MTAIIDYQAGNIGSIKNMLKKVGHPAVVTFSKDELSKADRIILPGVGSFDYGISKLAELGLVEILNEKKQSGVPILGICLGAQLMCQSSEEGKLPGLGWIKGHVRKFPLLNNGLKYTVPHMGWDVIDIAKRSEIFYEIPHPARYYFVHSYFINCEDDQDVLSRNSYSVDFHSAFERENIIGVQYHPEKSHNFGKQLLRNFIERF